MNYRLITAPFQDRKQYWSELTDLALRYNDRKTKVFRNRLKIAEGVGKKALIEGEYPKTTA